MSRRVVSKAVAPREVQHAVRAPHLGIGVLHLECAALDDTSRLLDAVAAHVHRHDLVPARGELLDDSRSEEAVRPRYRYSHLRPPYLFTILCLIS